MNRRPFLQTLAAGGALLTAGCADSLPLTAAELDSDAVFATSRFDGGDLVVEFRDDVDVREVALFDPSRDDEYETIDDPDRSVRFRIVLPERLETRLSPSLRVRAETADGIATLRVGGQVHAFVPDVEPLPDGRARLAIENQGTAPLLVRFVAVYGDVPNPTVDPQADAFDRSSFDRGPGVVGVDGNQRLSPSRTDLVVPADATRTFETTYAPFAFPDGVDAADCSGDERTGKVAVVHGSGGSAAYDFTYWLEGEATALEGRDAAVCAISEADTD
ncbi:hypothetical protein [Halopiger thermotolerans]